MEKIYHSKTSIGDWYSYNIPCKMNIKAKEIIRNKGRYFIMIQGY